MSNITKLENILSQSAEVDGLLPALGASLAWSAGMRYLNALIWLEDLGRQPGQPRFGTSDAVQRAEGRVEEAETVLAWALGYCTNEELKPTADQLLELAASTQSSAQDQLLTDEEMAAEFGCEVADIVAAREMDAAKQAEIQARLAESLALSRESIERRLRAGLDGSGFIEDGWDVDTTIAQRTAEKLAVKLEEHALRRMARATRTIRPRLRTKLAAEFRLTKALCEKADELSARLMCQIDTEGPGYAEKIDHRQDIDSRLCASSAADEN